MTYQSAYHPRSHSTSRDIQWLISKALDLLLGPKRSEVAGKLDEVIQEAGFVVVPRVRATEILTITWNSALSENAPGQR